MINFILPFKFINFFLCCLFALAAFTKSTQANEIKLLATTGMIADILKNITNDDYKIEQMMASGIDPHTYKPTAGDLKRIQTAKIIFYNGFHLESSLTKIFERMNKSYPICEIIENAKLLEGNYSIPDPHIWMDVLLWLECVQRASLILQKEFPMKKIEIKNATKNYKKKLVNLDAWIKKEISKIPISKRILITAHDAFSYFGKAYKFEVKGIQGISTATEAGVKDITNLADYVVQKKIPAIFVESSVSQHSILALKEAILAKNWNVVIGESLFSDSMGAENSGKDNYIAMMKHNVKAIVKALMR